MSLLFAAIGATVIALVEATVVPYVTVGNVGPHPVLVGGVIWTIAAGIDRGIAWAFVGGLVLDSLLGRSLGTSALALLLLSVVPRSSPSHFPACDSSHRSSPCRSSASPTPCWSAGVTSATQPGVALNEPIGLFVPGAIYDGIIGMFLGPIAVTIHDRRAATERVDW